MTKITHKGGRNLTITQLYSFYRELSYDSSNSDRSDGGLFERSFHSGPLPLYIYSGKTKYSLRKKQAFWRTFHQSKVNGEKYYYQQIVFNKAIFRTTFIAEKGNCSSWRDYFERLVFIGPENGGISVSRSYNISNLSDVSDFERGPEIARYELNVIINIELANNSATFVSGAAGTGKSYLLKMLEKHYKIEGYKIFKVAPTGVAAFNVNGITIYRFFAMANTSQEPDYLKLDEIVKLYPKVMLLVDEFSMISKPFLDIMNDALIGTNQGAAAMGGIKTIFFGNVAQLLPVRIDEGLIWDTPLYNFSAKFSLHTPIRQVDQKLIDVLNKVRVCNFDESDLPANCLRLYTTRSNVDRANIKELKRLEGESVAIHAFDIYNGMKQEAEGTQESLWIQRISRSIPGTSYVRTQFPIVPAFATTIHKAQSITIESVAIHLDHMPSHGQMYVATSRVRKADDLYFFGTDIPVRIKKKFDINLDAIDMIEYSEQKH
ncbi:hypothetical protein G6F43_009501 [Rhizopus delemar]|nr:hypothetical protein G6F43_009501 [Rhizopus delemar]